MSEQGEGSMQAAHTDAATQGQNEFRDDIIMMVDDEPLMIGVLEVYLQEQGFQHFIAVNDSTQAMDTILRERPDCVFLDLNMPEVDGFEILEKIRSTPEIQHLAAIVLTSDTDPETKLKALELGATDFLEKPIDSSELILRLRNTLRAKAYQDQLTYYDGLTRLPNRTFFLERLGASIEHAKQRRNDLALVMLSIDRFQAVNDSLGPMAGDEVLKAIAGRLRKIINDAGAGAHKSQDYGDRILARMGGDEFAFALPGRMSKSEVVELTDEIRNAMRKPFDYQGKQVFLTASMGMARYPHDAGETGQLLKSAGAARELAKKNGGNSLEQYSKDITAKADARRSLEAELHDALEKE
ncbi:MAG: diguanylate cyclase, partial [Halieaceae bacterium]|nr:diguanylate cyclase [Halieaceae bacterium]